MNRPPLLFNDLNLLDDSFYLVMDLFSSIWFYLIPAIILILTLFIKIIPRLFQTLSDAIVKIESTRRVGILSMVLLMGIIASHQIRLVVHDAAPAQFVASRMKHDLIDSYLMFNNAQNYTQSNIFESAVPGEITKNSSTPNIYVFFVESYGKILAEDQRMRSRYDQLMAQLNDSLLRNEWSAVTNYSRAPVIGGSSWLSALTFLSGKNIDNQIKYGYFTANYTPDFVTYLHRKGYHSVLLQPPTRERPGLPVNNLYKFDTSVVYDDLQYTGKKYGWGIIPDQYSIRFVQERYLSKISEPIFLFFTMVSSHVPWDIHQLPPYANEPHSSEDLLSLYQNDQDSEVSHRDKTDSNPDSYGFIENYLHFVSYDLQVIEQFILNDISPESVILIIGDHQPPILKQQNPNSQTPVHVISQNQVLLDTFKQYNFVPGMFMESDKENPVSHEDLFHIMFEALEKTGK
ncbi:MAG: hypothetical protein GF372_10540 [Candidatus Marinimicrobia bacterium]|nr:hypothetical protein [Candidatus Neomarinimicrobiota bacterium]